MATSKGIVLIYGAGLGRFIWDDIKPLLDQATLAIEFPNRNGGGKVNASLTFDDYVEAALKEIEDWDKDEIIIVAHSIGGLIGLKIAERLKNKVRGFIGLSSAIPKGNSSFVATLPFPMNMLMGMVIRFIGTKAPEAAIVKGLCNDLTKEQTKKIVDSFTPEAKSLYLHKTSFETPKCKRLYIKLIKDKEFPISFQDKMAENLEAHQSKTVDGGHLSMISKPRELAEVINQFAEKV